MATMAKFSPRTRRWPANFGKTGDRLSKLFLTANFKNKHFVNYVLLFMMPSIWDVPAPPGSCMFLWKAEHAKPTKPGPDTIPYAAWASLAGAYTLLLLFFSQTAGIIFNIGYNDSLAAFLPKGDDDKSDSNGS